MKALVRLLEIPESTAHFHEYGPFIGIYWVFHHWCLRLNNISPEMRSSFAQFGQEFGPEALFGALSFLYLGEVNNGGHALYFGSGSASGDGGGLWSEHDPAIPLHHDMIDAMESAGFHLLENGAKIHRIMRNFCREELRMGNELDQSFANVGAQWFAELIDVYARELGAYLESPPTNATVGLEPELIRR